MRRLLFFASVLLICIGSMASAQQDPLDPGTQDSIIVGQVYFDPTNSFVFVPVYAVTDDSVAGYTIPLGWFPRDIGVHAGSHAQYFHPFTTWDVVFDSLLLDEGYMRTIGWCDVYPETLNENIPLFTNGERVHIMTLNFVIPRDWPWQDIRIDTVTDERCGHILLWMADGMTEFMPAFQFGELLPMTGITGDDLPTSYSVSQNYPNPFNPTTTIEYGLPELSHVTIEIYDILGHRIETLFDGNQPAGRHRATWNADAIPSGIYFYRIEAGDRVVSRKMLLLK